MFAGLSNKIGLIGLVLSIVHVPVANAAENWSGFYIGASAGYAWGQSSANTGSDCPGTGVTRLGYYCDGGVPGLLPNSAAVGASGSGSLSQSGFTGGGQAGYNVQRGNWVLGLEADFSSLRLNGSRAGPRTFYPALGAGTAFTVNSSIDSSWLMTARARAGWTVSNALIFVTAGLAVSELTVSNSFLDNASIVIGTNASGSGSTREIKGGYAVGGGVEWSLTRNWSVKGEYLYVDLGDVQASARVTNPGFLAPGASNLVTTSTDLTAHIARFGANYRF